MSETGILIQVLGAGLIALGLLAILVGFFMTLFRARQENSRGIAFFGLGVILIVLGAWLMRLDVATG